MTWEPNRLEQTRLEKLNQLREAGIDPYPWRVERTHNTAEALALLTAETGHSEGGEEPVVTVCGRVVGLRDMGKTVFSHIEDGSGRIQLFINRDLVGETAHTIYRKQIDLGDFVQATGALFRTRTGEVSVRVTNWRLLSKAITPLPAGKEQEVDGQVVRYSAISDVEDRYRQRYADLAVNPEVRQVFRTRARIVSLVRRFLDDNGFLEVETPIMQPLYGGAAARPFITHHNQLKQDLYLRIAFELYLKRLLIGNLERVYEIGRDFRNEGVDATHNPEFTQMEVYAAYWDYHDVMDFTEKMYRFLCQELTGGSTLTYQGHTVDFGQPWQRITLREAIKQFAEIDYMDYPTTESLVEAIRQIGGHPPKDATWGRLIDKILLGNYVEPRLTQPTFITEYPRDISPLAKGIPGDPFHVARFDDFSAAWEMGNAVSEANDPIVHLQCFEYMQLQSTTEQAEAHPIDEDYLRAMRYGMPPNGGFGTGIDRITMLFTDNVTIREVLLFPHLRDSE